MCHFITLIAPTEDLQALRSVMKLHGRSAHPVQNVSVQKVLNEDERQYLTYGKSGCDCGTLLAARKSDDEEKVERSVLRMKRKGWSATKIARAIEDQNNTNALKDNNGPDSYALWLSILNDLKQMGLRQVGLIVKLYSGAIENESFIAKRRNAPVEQSWRETLESMLEDEVTIFRLN